MGSQSSATEGSGSVDGGMSNNAEHMFVNVKEYHDYAKRYLPRQVYDYYASGATDMITLRMNEKAFSSVLLRPRCLRDVSSIKTQTSVLGHPIASPIAIAPTAMHCMAHESGERATARAAKGLGTCMVLSSWSTTSIEDVAKASGDGLRWFQLYVYKDRDITANLVRRAEASGFRAIVLTVDTPVLGRREADIRNGFSLPSHLQLANFEPAEDKSLAEGVKAKRGASGLASYVASLQDATLTWDIIEWLQSITALPIVVKGVLNADDAKEAVRRGCKGVIVSNHGARQLDTSPATIHVLKEVVDAVEGRIEVYMDGGVRRGTDVVKALSLGARVVFVGRPVLWGLAHKGQQGVENVLKLLNDELKQALQLLGCANVQDLNESYVYQGLRRGSRL